MAVEKYALDKYQLAELRHFYLDLRQSRKKVAEHFGWTYNAARFILRKYDVRRYKQNRSQPDPERADKELSLEYLAGFFDGEGSIGITKGHAKEMINPKYELRLTLVNTDKEIMEEIHRLYGGIFDTRRFEQAKWRTVYQVIWTNTKAEKILNALEPHLRVKKKQAQLALQYRRKMIRYDGKGQGATMPQSEVAFRELMRRKIRALNGLTGPAYNEA